MIEIQTRNGVVKIFAKTVEPTALSQIYALANSPMGEGASIRIMPDVHAGSGCVIGTTMRVVDKITPMLVGVDIGCGMETAILDEDSVNFKKLDEVIRSQVPSGFEIRKKRHAFSDKVNLVDLVCRQNVDVNKGYLSIGTLGGGNHFCELNHDENGRLYLVIHSGSRNLGKQVCEYYQRLAFDTMRKKSKNKSDLIASLKAQGREAELSSVLKQQKVAEVKFDKNLTWLEGQDFDNYIHDMKIMQMFALLNRQAMVQTICTAMNWKIADSFSTIHNYIDMDAMILRKGAIRALDGERVLIPMNMQFGSLLCRGKGNPDWNFSAPHGAGRIMSRGEAKRRVRLDAFAKAMKGIYSTSVSEATLDESPFAYKPPKEIMECILDTVEIVSVLKPIYNFKETMNK